VQNALAAVLLLVVAILVLRAVTRERRDYARFKRMRSTRARQRVYRRWFVESVTLLGGLTVAVLLAAAPLVPGTLAEVRALPPVAAAVDALEGPLGAVLVIVGVAALVGVIVLTVVVGRTADELPTIGDVTALIPRTRGELRWGAALALQAGVIEELLFRLALPALIAGVTGSALAGFALSCVLFGALHLYQRLPGVIAATLLAVVFTLLYLATGTIVVPIVLHALIDLRSLVLLPIVVTRAHRIPG